MSLSRRLPGIVADHLVGTVLFLLGLAVLAVLRLVGGEGSTDRWRPGRRDGWHAESGDR